MVSTVKEQILRRIMFNQLFRLDLAWNTFYKNMMSNSTFFFTFHLHVQVFSSLNKNDYVNEYFVESKQFTVKYDDLKRTFFYTLRNI